MGARCCLGLAPLPPLRPAAPAVVFKMHYNELLAKTEEVQKLKAIIEGLSNQR